MFFHLHRYGEEAPISAPRKLGKNCSSAKRYSLNAFASLPYVAFDIWREQTLKTLPNPAPAVKRQE
jgi:hypothetical protein